MHEVTLETIGYILVGGFAVVSFLLYVVICDITVISNQIKNLER